MSDAGKLPLPKHVDSGREQLRGGVRLKTCTGCKKTKPIDAFALNKRHRDGRNYRCKDCCNAYNKEYAAKNREKLIERKRVYRENNRDKIAAYNAERADAQKQYYRKNRKRLREYQKQHREATKHQRRRILETDLGARLKYLWKARRSDAKRRGIVFDITVDDLKSLHDRQKGMCAVTGLPFNMMRDHDFRAAPFGPSVDKIRAEGGYTVDNIQLVCFMVNMGKSQYPIEDFDAMCRARVAVLDGETNAPA